MELDLKGRFRINLVAITRPRAEGPGRINAVPLGSDLIQAGDILAVAGRDEDLKKLLAENLESRI
jgi:Trk K+ transport system NAD-binding subunit